jgi:hypothetical protein
MCSANGERNRPRGIILVTCSEGLRALDVRQYMTDLRVSRSKPWLKGASDKFLEHCVGGYNLIECQQQPQSYDR